MLLKEKIIKTLPALFILFCIAIASNMSEQYLSMQLQIEMRSESVSFFLIVFMIIITGLASAFVQEAAFLTNIEWIRPIPEFSLSTRYLDLIRENLKAIGSASLWMFLFIIPGIIKWIQYSLVPFVVFLNPQYQKGEREALSYSAAITKKCSWKFYLLWIIFNCVIPIALSILGGEYEYFRETPTIAILISFIQSFIFWAWMLIIWDFYEENHHKLETKAI